MIIENNFFFQNKNYYVIFLNRLNPLDKSKNIYYYPKYNFFNYRYNHFACTWKDSIYFSLFLKDYSFLLSHLDLNTKEFFKNIYSFHIFVFCLMLGPNVPKLFDIPNAKCVRRSRIKAILKESIYLNFLKKRTPKHYYFFLRLVANNRKIGWFCMKNLSKVSYPTDNVIQL